jgi:hypothetical protein
VKYSCKECKGSAFCVHDKIKYRCVECKFLNTKVSTREVPVPLTPFPDDMYI